MNFKFIGGVREIGKSCVLMQDEGQKILFDYGMKVHQTQERPDEVELADYLIISHAHIDHFGFLPIFYRMASAKMEKPTQSFCTHPTIPLMNLLFEDTIRIAEREQKNPPFSVNEMKRATRHCTSMPYNSPYIFPNGSSFEFLDAGHIEGSAQILYQGKKNVLYTGDINTLNTKMHDGAQSCKDKIDVMITESTYALRDHPNRDTMEREFCNALQDTVDNKGIALVPCFAIGRTQELLQVLLERKIDAEIYLDGMGIEATTIMLDFPEYLKDAKKLQRALESSVIIEHNKKNALRKPGIIIATAGMLEGGPVLNYITKLNKIKNSKVFLTGFQAPNTNGRRLLQEGRIRIGRHFEKVGLEIQQYDFSAHSGKKELYDYVKKVNPEKVFCMHGDDESCSTFAEELKKEGFDATAPRVNEKFEV